MPSQMLILQIKSSFPWGNEGGGRAGSVGDVYLSQAEGAWSRLPSLSDEIGGWILKTKMLLSPSSVFLKCFTGLSKTESRRRWLQQKTCKLEVGWGERRLGPEESCLSQALQRHSFSPSSSQNKESAPNSAKQ